MVANVKFCGNHGNQCFSRAHIGFFHGRRFKCPFCGYAVSCAVAAFLGGADAFVWVGYGLGMEIQSVMLLGCLPCVLGCLDVGKAACCFRRPFFRLLVLPV